MKLSQKKARRLTFVASKLALSIDQDERMALLTELLDELGITDAEQRADSKDSAARHLRYTAQQRRKAARQADDIDRMNLDELQASNKEMLAKLKRLLEERRAEQPASTPEPAPVVSDAPQYALPTKRMEKAIARFDDLSDEQQLDVLGQMWGQP